METMEFTPKGVCARKIDITTEDGVVRNVEFTGGHPRSICSPRRESTSRVV